MKAGIELPYEQLADFCRRNHIRELALFGSVLRNDFTSDSDVDVLVEFEPGIEDSLTLFDLAGMQIELSDIFQREVDLIIRESLKPLLRSNILETSETVYAL